MTVRPARDLARGVRARTADLYTRDTGEGQAVLLLHAFPLNSRMWEPQTTALAGRCRLVAPDMPGFGLSPPPVTAASLDDWARAVLAVLAALEIERVIVVGLSMGGYLAFRLIEPLGPRLVGLLLVDTRATPDTEEAAVRRHELAAEVELSGVEAVAGEFLPKLLGQTTQRTRPELLDRLHAMILENSPAGVAGALRAMAARPDSTPLLAHIRCPVVCVAGDEDVITPPDVMSAMSEQIPGARMRTVPLAGHLSSLEAPEPFNDALGDLLQVCTRS